MHTKEYLKSHNLFSVLTGGLSILDIAGGRLNVWQRVSSLINSFITSFSGLSVSPNIGSILSLIEVILPFAFLVIGRY